MNILTAQDNLIITIQIPLISWIIGIDIPAGIDSLDRSDSNKVLFIKTDLPYFPPRSLKRPAPTDPAY